MVELIGVLLLGAVGVESVALFSIGAVAITTGTVVGAAAVIAASIGLQYLLAPKGGAATGSAGLPPPEAGHQPLRQTIPPRIVGLGRVRLAGSYMLFEADAGVSYDITALHHGRLGGIVGYYLHDDVVTIDPVSGVVDAYGDGRYGSSLLTIKTRLGAVPETAYSEITAALPSFWTAAHRGDGVASLMLICGQAATSNVFPDVFPRGLPLPSVVADCTPIFDPREALQYRADPSTWAVSANPVLQVMFFLTDADRGMGLDWDVLIEPVLDDLIAQADLCDAAVALNAGGSEPRYHANGSYALDSDPADVIASILEACDGWISQNGDGSLSLQVGVYRAPLVVIESKHIRGAAIQYGSAEEEAVNELTIQYTSPLLDYKTAPGQPWRDETDISERGKTLSQAFALPWVYSHSQARRLAKRRMARLQAQLHGSITTTIYGLRALGERWIAIQAPDYPDLEDIVVEVLGVTFDLINAQCVIRFVVINPNAIDAWDAATEEGSAPTVPDKLVAPAAPVPTGLANNGTTDHDNAFRLKFNDPGRADLQFQMRWRVSGSGGAYTVSDLLNATAHSAGMLKVKIDGGIPGSGPESFEVALRSLGNTGAGSAYCSPITIALTS